MLTPISNLKCHGRKILCTLEKIYMYLVYIEDLFRPSYIAINVLCNSESAKGWSLPPGLAVAPCTCDHSC